MFIDKLHSLRLNLLTDIMDLESVAASKANWLSSKTINVCCFVQVEVRNGGEIDESIQINLKRRRCYLINQTPPREVYRYFY